MLFFYNFSIQLYFIGVRTVALWNKKAREWLSGRKDLFSVLKKKISVNDRIIWLHCSSAGEFEQGKPLIEKLKSNYPAHKILISFFSPSGYNTACHYKQADMVTYLPLDTKKNAKRFIELVNPELVIFVKYEFWYHHLSVAAFKHIPLLLVSAAFRNDQPFFKWYGKFYRQMLFLFRHIFVQDEISQQLLKQANITHCSISGDTRFDRVYEIREKFTEVPLLKDFIAGNKVIVAGSTWTDDEQLLFGYNGLKLIIAPHEITPSHLTQIKKRFRNSVRYSELPGAGKEKAHVLIIDNVGMLSRLYYYATVSYVGGGFTKDGIHNILEAAVYGRPIIFGPNYKKYREANELIEAGGAFSVENGTQLTERLNALLKDEEKLRDAGRKAQNYVQKKRGATDIVIQFIHANRLLTK